MRNRAVLLCLLSLPALAGCGGGSPSLVPVTGKLTLNGRPLKRATVVFTPDRARGGRGPQSFDVTGDDGTFTLRTTEGMGAVVGWHQVTVAPPADDADLMALMEKFLDPDRSGLSREVKAGATNVIALSLDVTP
jgi:hypothetical protein